ncbi:MAG TPA: hypothetical protein VGS20_06620 [Candidatus Acidoferrales bacterium]|nr:hypothetical protein [Candidatus Acidoferrales bacterium]
MKRSWLNSMKAAEKKNAGMGLVSVGIIGQGVSLVLWSFRDPVGAFLVAIGILLFTTAEAELSRLMRSEWREGQGEQ